MSDWCLVKLNWGWGRLETRPTVALEFFWNFFQNSMLLLMSLAAPFPPSSTFTDTPVWQTNVLWAGPRWINLFIHSLINKSINELIHELIYWQSFQNKILPAELFFTKFLSMSHFHPKTLFEIAMLLLTISVSFPSKSRFSATFSILLRFGESWNPKSREKFNANGSLMGRTNLDKSVW